MNEKALTEMADAQRKLAEAYELFGEMLNKIRASHDSFKEANATSVNKDASCYVEMAQQVNLGYVGLIEGVKRLNAAFCHPKIERMIVAGEKNHD